MPNHEYPWSMYMHLWTSLPPAPKGDYLAGKVVVITGANSGVGLEATKQLAAAKPAKLILAIRSVDAGKTIIEQLKAKHPGLDAEAIPLDLSKISSIKEFAQSASKLDKIDVLINNAGINPNFDDGPYKSTEDGYERVFQVNVLAPLLTTLLVLPTLRRSPAPKVIFTGSDGHAYADDGLIRTAVSSRRSITAAFNDEKVYDNGSRYFQSKLLLQMVTRTLISALPDVNIINVNPDMARTNLGRDFNFNLSLKTFKMVMLFIFNSRSAGNAARNLTTAVANATESHDYWSEGVPSYSESAYLTSKNGIDATKQFYEEIVAEVEKVSPGSSTGLKN
ncbi:hypothetical protein IAT38_001304 [Cryptococcus sp. DSM 104549]